MTEAYDKTLNCKNYDETGTNIWYMKENLTLYLNEHIFN